MEEYDWAKGAFERDFGEDSDELLQKAEAAAAAAEKKMAKPRTGEELLGVPINEYRDVELKQQMALTKKMSEENPGFETMFDKTFKVYQNELKKRYPEKENKKENKKGGRKRKTKKRKGGKKKRKTHKKKVNKRKTRRKLYKKKKSSRKTKRRR